MFGRTRTTGIEGLSKLFSSIARFARDCAVDVCAFFIDYSTRIPSHGVRYVQTSRLKNSPNILQSIFHARGGQVVRAGLLTAKSRESRALEGHGGKRHHALTPSTLMVFLRRTMQFDGGSCRFISRPCIIRACCHPPFIYRHSS